MRKALFAIGVLVVVLILLHIFCRGLDNGNMGKQTVSAVPHTIGTIKTRYTPNVPSINERTNTRHPSELEKNATVWPVLAQDTTNGLVRLPIGHMRPKHILKAEKDGISAKITFVVVDDEGQSVPDATVAGGFFNHRRGKHGFSQKTDHKGTVSLEDVCVGDINYKVEKDGYYETRDRYWFFKSGFDCVKDGHWIPWNPAVKVVLKRKVNPVAMYAADRGSNYTLIPQVGEPHGFDLTVGDWVFPHGRGKTRDFDVTYIRDGSGRAFTTQELILSVREPFAGFRKVSCDTYSALKSPYRADKNAVYEKEVRFSFKRSGETARYIDGQMKADECIVLRTRTRVDEDGRLIGAHYGKIYGPLCFGISLDAPGEMKILHYFNPNENDSNLETDTTKNLLTPGDLGFAP